MEPAGVVHAWSRLSAALRPRRRWARVLKARASALSRSAAALRPGGLLLDVQANGSWVEVVVGWAILPLGHLGSHRRETRDIEETLVTRTARQAAIDAGQLVLEREVRFPLVVHYDTVDSWLTEVAQEEPKLAIPAGIVRRARQLLPPGTAGEVCDAYHGYAGLLRRNRSESSS